MGRALQVLWCYGWCQKQKQKLTTYQFWTQLVEYSLLSSRPTCNKILFSIRTQSEAASFAQSRILWIITSSTLLKNMRSSWFIELNCRMWTRCCCRNVNNKPIIFPLDYLFCPIPSESGVHRIILSCSVAVNLKVQKILTLREEVCV